MDDDRIYHVKLHERGRNWSTNIILLSIYVLWGGLLLWLYLLANREPYVLDLNNAEQSATLDYTSRFEIIVRTETENGSEIRLYDPDSGKLLGTIIESGSIDQPEAE